MPVRIKVCGLTTEEAIRAAVVAEVDAVGFVFTESPRQVTIDRACDLARGLPSTILRVDPDQDQVKQVIDRFAPDLVQTEPGEGAAAVVNPLLGVLPVFHDDEDIVAVASAHWRQAGPFRALLLEAAGRGGRGRQPSWDRAAELSRSVPLVLAGGLAPDNVADAVQHVRPWGVDVSSGIESAPGVKDPQRISAFVDAVHMAERTIKQPR